MSVARASETGGKFFRCLHLFFFADVALCFFGFFFFLGRRCERTPALGLPEGCLAQ